MASAANQRRTYDKRVNTADGHYVKWDITARDLTLLQSWQFMKNYRTFCQISPPSWDFRMCFPEIRADGTATLSIYAKRADLRQEVQLEACVWVDVYDPADNLIYPKKSFVKRDFKAGDVLEERVELEPYPGMQNAVQHNVLVQVTLTVTDCHPSE